MPPFLTDDRPADALDLHIVRAGAWADWLASAPQRAWIEQGGTSGKAGTCVLLPGPDGGLAGAVAVVPDTDVVWDWAGLPTALPERTVAIVTDLDAASATRAALGWTLGTYRYDRFKKSDARFATLVWPAAADRGRVARTEAATRLVRDLINTPAGDMGPPELEAAARDLADRFGAEIHVTVGDDLLAANYPAIHAVGRAAAKAPRLIDLRWGDPAAPRLTLVGKGVCFDTGGLDIKPAAGMKLMKKDMGGAAHVLGLASMVMDAGLPVRLRVLVPAVENAIAGNALYPLDVIRTRHGQTVEIGHTDAEGRVILSDALAEASSEKPELIIDVATLTGAARVALGTELPALFCNDDDVAQALLDGGRAEADNLWRMPLWQDYRPLVEGKTADLTNSPEGGFGGAITAALFLESFVAKGLPWIHIDVMAWNTRSRPGRPEGGEAMGLRALYALVSGKFGK
ncbi:MAG: leucyl aminopeptidase family protein [Hyphomicrobiales bacterium]|nr:leucyl aminopeptidase family protein [Hyphomicrobiales bacterium]MCP5370347.1 leucyl aminopeptidase family protein [Hyphomicrobiales bacterium]